MLLRDTAVGLLALLATPVFANEPPRFNIEATCRAAQPLGPEDRAPYDGCVRDESEARSQLVEPAARYPTSIDRHALPRPAWGLTLAMSRFSLAFRCTAVGRPLRYVLGFDAGHEFACAARVRREDTQGAVHRKQTCLKPLEERRMVTKLHHVNLCSNNVPEMDRFYREVLDLAPIPGRNEQRVTNEGYSGEVAFVTDGATEVHLAAKDLGISFRTGQAINPVEKGHIAFRTDDIAAVKFRLKDRGIPFSDYGTWAMKGWHQIFFHDPEGNVIEVHQIMLE